MKCKDDNTIECPGRFKGCCYDGYVRTNKQYKAKLIREVNKQEIVRPGFTVTEDHACVKCTMEEKYA